jgi:hypothetical protein
MRNNNRLGVNARHGRQHNLNLHLTIEVMQLDALWRPRAMPPNPRRFGV